MSWGTPFTAVVGLPIRASDANQTRDNLLETAPAKFTTAGDLFVGTGANAGARLPKGSDGQLLRVVAGAVGWSTFGQADLGSARRCRVYLNLTTQSVPNATDTVIQFNAVSEDPNSWWDSTNKVIRPTVAGVGLVILNAEWAPSTGGGERVFEIKDNAGATWAGSRQTPSNARLVASLSCLKTFDGSASYVYGSAYQGSGGALNVQSNGPAVNLSVVMFPGTA